jgi:glycosyltransferase involved in cell wall biosynthesis
MRIAILYDCLYPHTVGGAERWYRNLAERLAAHHTVSYVTRRQWDHSQTPDAPPGVDVVAVSGGRDLYTASGRRKVSTPLRYGWGVFWHLVRHRQRYDIVHTCGFPYFSVIAARLACAAGGPKVVTDWLEIWSRRYWIEYLGPASGRIGAAVQRLCIRLGGPSFVLSDLHAERLLQEGHRGRPIPLNGIYAGPTEPLEAPLRRDPLVVYVGRHFAHKRVVALPGAVAAARERIPGLRAIIFGDGPDRIRVMAEVERLGLQEAITCPGFAPWQEVDAALRRALCLVFPSQREGYGLVIVEAAARGTPSIVVRDPDNAATELIEEGENGFVTDSTRPRALADAIIAVQAAGPALVRRTRAWFTNNAKRLTIDASIVQLERVYTEIANGAGGNGEQRGSETEPPTQAGVAANAGATDITVWENQPSAE